MADIVERLEKSAAFWAQIEAGKTMHDEAVDAAAEIKRLRAALDKMKRSRDRYRQAWEAEKARTALGGSDD